MPREQYYNEGYRVGFKDGYAAGTVDAFQLNLLDVRESPKPKRKRTKSAYQKRYGAAYKRLKKKHPRMSFGSLSKKAHKEARK